MARTGEKRPWLAGLLAIVHPGLGHLYLREWARALLWFALALTTVSLLLPTEFVADTTTLEGVMALSRDLPQDVALALAGVVLVSTVDAIRLAKRKNEQSRRQAAGASCPNCGKEVDPEIDFCHWCTTELAAVPESAPEDHRE